MHTNVAQYKHLHTSSPLAPEKEFILHNKERCRCPASKILLMFKQGNIIKKKKASNSGCMLYEHTSVKDYVMPQAVSHQPLTSEAWF
jgi:hypothetical protein